MSSAPHAVNHVGINVPDLPAAVGGAGVRFARMNGPGFRRGRVAYLTSANGVGFEMFEFIEPRTEPFRDDWEYWRPGPWHVCLTTPDVPALAAAIAANGGRRRTEVLEASPGSGFWMTFCQDPWGNPVELMSASYGRIAQASA